MLHRAQLPNKYWTEAAFTACYLQNCSYTLALNYIIPFELWTGIKPNLCHLRIFGCKGFSHIPDEKRTKFAIKSTPVYLWAMVNLWRLKAIAFITLQLNKFSPVEM